MKKLRFRARKLTPEEAATMDPINFVGVNRVLNAPAELTVEECGSLPVYSDGKVCVSCWELSDHEVETLIKTRRVYVLIMSGHTQPPMIVSVHKDSLIP